MGVPSATDFTPAERRCIRTRLLRWYRASKEPLPWRRRPTPYRTWIAEAMLQQTQVATVVPYYQRFLKLFPNLKALAASSEHDLLKAWEGLGYYNRALNLRKAARRICQVHRGRFPQTLEALTALPGIGRYTACAILSIALGQDVPVVDGNVIRVLSRLLDYDGEVTRGPARELFWQVAGRLVPSGAAGDFNQGLMELGRRVCKPRGPLCAHCPLQAVCRACLAGTQDQRPRKGPVRPLPHHDVGAAVIWRDGRVLIARRPSTGFLAGLWEFPGGKRRPGEDIRACVRREVREEVGLDVEVGPALMTVRHAYSHFRVTLHFHECRPVAGRARALGCAACRWVDPGRLSRYAFPAGSWPLVRALAGTAGRPPRRGP